jgi:predicted enzyme related to lactoylglutathione lyase
MGERTSHEPGTFSWMDLGSSDAAAAKQFYGPLFDWEFDERPMGEGQTYSMAMRDGKTVAAIYNKGADQGPPAWNAYVTVESVDELAPRVAEAGGTLLMEPFDVFDSGRMAIVQDPTGAYIQFWEAREHIGAQLVNSPGALVWNSLATDDVERAKAFYAELLGWEYDEGDGEVRVRNRGTLNGSIRQKGPDEAAIPSNWSVCMTVEDLDGAVSRADAQGGRVLIARERMDEFGHFAVVSDPQGAVFAMYEGEVDP